jgi:hypothetical protein
LRIGRTICAAQKENFNLLWFAKRSRSEYFDVFDLHSDLFAQLATQRIERLFAGFEKPSGQTPTATRAKTMFQQQHLSFVIENDRARRDGESRMRGAHTPAPKSRRQQSPNFAAEVFKHSRENII